MESLKRTGERLFGKRKGGGKRDSPYLAARVHLREIPFFESDKNDICLPLCVYKRITISFITFHIEVNGTRKPWEGVEGTVRGGKGSLISIGVKYGKSQYFKRLHGSSRKQRSPFQSQKEGISASRDKEISIGSL